MTDVQRRALLDGFGPHHTRIDSLDIAFPHGRSPVPGAAPLLTTHGRPGSVPRSSGTSQFLFLTNQREDTHHAARANRPRRG
jgi:hypothetical protein